MRPLSARLRANGSPAVVLEVDQSNGDLAMVWILFRAHGIAIDAVDARFVEILPIETLGDRDPISLLLSLEDRLAREAAEEGAPR